MFEFPSLGTGVANMFTKKNQLLYLEGLLEKVQSGIVFLHMMSLLYRGGFLVKSAHSVKYIY